MCLILDKTAQTFSLAKKFKTASSLFKPAPESFFSTVRNMYLKSFKM